MRYIKFRAKRKLTGEWVYGNYINVGNDWCQIIPKGSDCEELNIYSIRVITESVGQYIELKDYNGNYVYEGDIIKCFHDEPGTKYYSECTKTVFYENGCLMPFYDYLVSCELHFIDKYPKFEVIGNIHDNNIKL